MTEYTKGKWKIIKADEADCNYVTKLADYLIVPHKNKEGERILGNIKADAQLIVTAPALLEKAEEIIEDCKPIPENDYEKFAVSSYLLHDLDKIIQKAKGELNE